LGPTLYPIGTLPVSVAVADLNGDGIPDMVTANSLHNNVSVLLGNGDGSFKPLVNYPGGPTPNAVAVADFNHDGIPDLAVANDVDGGTVSVLLGNGDGSFQNPVSYSAGNYAYGLAVGDFTGHGNRDLVVVDNGHVLPYRPGGLSVLLSNGDGTFKPPVFYSTGQYPFPYGVAVGDFRGNGVADLVAAIAGGSSVQVFLGNGDGSFQNPVTYAVGSYPYRVAVADLRGNGISDLVTANGAGVSVLLGNGNGTFQAHQDYAAGPVNSVAVADLNGDGIPDVVTANSYPTATISVLSGNGDGTFQARVAYGNGTGSSIVLADLRRHRTIDAITTCYDAGGSISVLLGNGDGTFPLTRSYALATGPHSVAIGDLRANGTNDLVVLVGGTLGVLLGNADGSFREPVYYQTGNGSGVALSDLTGNGVLDLVVADYFADAVRVFLGNGDGSFQGPAFYDAGRHPVAVAVADLNGDGVPDIVTANSSYMGDGGLNVLSGHGDGSFQAPVSYPLGTDPQSLAVVDVNGDGIPDIVTVNQYAGSETVSVLLGNGDGSLGPPVFLAVGVNYRPTSLAVGDFRRNGIVDLVVTDEPFSGSPGYVRVLLGNGDGSFQLPINHPLGYGPQSLAVADFTGTGTLDLAITEGDTVWVMLGNGDGSFGPPSPYAGGYRAGAVAVGDLGGQGRDDLAVGSDNALRIMLNDGNWAAPHGVGPLLSRTARHSPTQDVLALSANLTTAPASPRGSSPPWSPSQPTPATPDLVPRSRPPCVEEDGAPVFLAEVGADERPGWFRASPESLAEAVPDVCTAIFDYWQDARDNLLRN
jgi:hypothetical protein